MYLIVGKSVAVETGGAVAVESRSPDIYEAGIVLEIKVRERYWNILHMQIVSNLDWKSFYDFQTSFITVCELLCYSVAAFSVSDNFSYPSLRCRCVHA